MQSSSTYAGRPDAPGSSPSDNSGKGRVKAPKKTSGKKSLMAEKEANLDAIIENFDGYIWSLDRDLRYTVLNSALRDKLKELTGIDAQPGDKMPDIMDVLDPSKRDEWKKIYDLGFEGQRQRFLQQYNIEGVKSFYEVSVNPIRKGKEVRGLSCFARDVTAEVMNEKKLQSSEMRFRTLIENGSDIIVVVNVEGKITYSSPYIEKHFKLSTEEQLGSDIFQYIHPEDLSRISEEFVDMLEKPGIPLHVQARAHTPEGRQIWVEGIVTNFLGVEGIDGIVCNFKDVTEWIQARGLLQQRELRFRSLIENNADIIMMADAAGKFIYGSPAVKKYLGYSEEDYLGISVFHLVHPDSIPLAQQLLENLMAHAGETFTIYLTLLHKDGSMVWVEGVATNLFHVPGVNALVANFRDIGERRKAEKLARESEDLSRKLQHELAEEKIRRQQEIMRASIDAQEKEREEIGRELHDNVNQLLTTAKLCLACLQDKTQADAPIHTQAPIIQRCAETITTAIEEIRKLSRTMTQSFHRDVGLKLSVDDLIENIRRIDKGIRVQFDFSLPDEKRLDDKLKMTLFRIVQEQLNNILKHADARSILISLRKESTGISLLIKDDGKGFDPLLKRKGIGITNIINRVEVFNGQVEIFSSPGNGCSMTAYFRNIQ